MLDKEQLAQLESVNSKLLKINQEMLIELRKTKFDKEAVLKELERIRHIDDVESLFMLKQTVYYASVLLSWAILRLE